MNEKQYSRSLARASSTLPVDSHKSVLSIENIVQWCLSSHRIIICDKDGAKQLTEQRMNLLDPSILKSQK